MSSVTPSSVDDAPAAARLERPPKEAAGEERWLPRTNANGALQSAAASLHIATGLELRGMAVAAARGSGGAGVEGAAMRRRKREMFWCVWALPHAHGYYERGC